MTTLRNRIQAGLEEIEDTGAYYIHHAEQRSEGWFRLRRWDGEHIPVLSASLVAAALGFDKFKSKEQLMLSMLGRAEEPVVTEESKRHMERGVILEPKAIDSFCEQYQAKVYPSGMAIAKFADSENPLKVKLDRRIGYSPDGLVAQYKGEEVDYLIEVKCPHKLSTYESILTSHYIQMQVGMVITGKQKCIYYQYTESGSRLAEVPFSPQYWVQVILPGLDKFFSELEEMSRQKV